MSRSNEEWKNVVDDIIQEASSASTTVDSPDISQLEANPKHIASYIDHTVLKLDATEQQIDQMCAEAADYDFAAVCVRENFVIRAKENPATRTIPIACVVGFHEGTQSIGSKLEEAKRAVLDGALELDVVLNRDHLKSGDYLAIYNELQQIRVAAPDPVQLKLILETSQLDQNEIIIASTLAAYAGWDYIKTSTGFNGRGASIEDIELMYKLTLILSKKSGNQSTVAKRMKVKASGGIRNFTDAKVMIKAGASRIGASAGVAIMNEASEQ